MDHDVDLTAVAQGVSRDRAAKERFWAFEASLPEGDRTKLRALRRSLARWMADTSTLSTVESLCDATLVAWEALHEVGPR